MTEWKRSTRCSTNSCVEVADLPDGSVAIRDSKKPADPPKVFSGTAWAEFLEGARAGEFGQYAEDERVQVL